jgi:TRAP transporter TAXI family solute receptor
MTRWTHVVCLLAAWFLTTASGPDARAEAGEPSLIISGPERGTYIRFARDLADLVARPAGIDLRVLASNGSTENIHRLRSEPAIRLALVQSDVYQAFIDESRGGSAEALYVLAPLRVVMPLYAEELHFVVRADSAMVHIHDIAGKRINVGLPGSGTALSAITVYRQMFETGIAEKNASFLSNEDALRRLVDERDVDVVVIAGGQPTRIFAEMTAAASQYIKLLRLDPEAPQSRAALRTYGMSTLRSQSYPSWLGGDVPTLSMRAMLVTYDFKDARAQRMLQRLAVSWCLQREQLLLAGHAKWREVNLALPPLGQGWQYFEPTRQVLETCQDKASNGRHKSAPDSALSGRDTTGHTRP